MDRRTVFCLACLGLFAFLGWSSGQFFVPRATRADELPPAEKREPPPCDVAVIDIGKVYKEHIDFKKGMDILKSEMEGFQAKVKAEQKEMEQRALQAKTLKEGSEPRRLEEIRLVTGAKELELASKEMQTRLMNEEAALYHRTYLDISAKTTTFARVKGIRVVLRYNSDPINPDDRKSVLDGVNNSIVFQDQLDITAEIIRRVNNLPDKS